VNDDDIEDVEPVARSSLTGYEIELATRFIHANILLREFTRDIFVSELLLAVPTGARLEHLISGISDESPVTIFPEDGRACVSPFVREYVTSREGASATIERNERAKIGVKGLKVRSQFATLFVCNSLRANELFLRKRCIV